MSASQQSSWAKVHTFGHTCLAAGVPFLILSKMEILNIDERNELERCEVVIKQGLDTFVEVGQALLTIRDKRLYRASFRTFEEYCSERWSMSKPYSHQMIAAAKVVGNLSAHADILPQTEYHARPLAAIEPELQPIAWQQAIEATDGKPTNKAVQEAVNELKPVNEEIKQAKAEPLFVANSVSEIIEKARELRREKHAEVLERREQIRKDLEKQQLDKGNKKYRVIYADPPWSYSNEMPEYVTTPDDYYTLMPTPEICAMPVKEMTEQNAVLFLWTTSPHLPEALQVCEAWGFKYKTTFIWDKVLHNMGHYNSVRHEILLVCVKGSCTPDVKKLYDSVYSEERTAHSKKPEFFRQVIDTIYPYGNRIELFARQVPDGWDVFGNQAS